MRKRSFADALDKHFSLGDNLNQRDVIAVRKTVTGLLKLLFPHGEYDKDIVRQCLEYALEVRRRVKEQLKKSGGMGFYDVHFTSRARSATSSERFVTDQAALYAVNGALGEEGLTFIFDWFNLARISNVLPATWQQGSSGA